MDLLSSGSASGLAGGPLLLAAAYLVPAVFAFSIGGRERAHPAHVVGLGLSRPRRVIAGANGRLGRGLARL
eukprot:4734188-Lingulodinium_polyedra.AAC.1